jgi:hypothetical protein
VVGLFGGKAAREGVKTSVAVKGNRKATMSDSAGQIVDLGEEKIYDVDLKKKTFKVTTFAEFRQRMEEARRKAEEEARKEQTQEKPEAAPPPKDPNEKQIEVDFNVKETGVKKTINGFDTREVVMTVALREKGKTLEEGGGLVLTSDMWLAAKIDAMKEIAEFDIRYAKQLAGPVLVGASPEDMAAAIAMYPGTKEAIARMRAESVNLDGTAILTSVTIDAVKTAEQMAQEQKQSEQSSSSSSGGGGVSGLIGGFAKRAVAKKEPPKSRVTFLTMTNEVLKVATDVSAADLEIPAGFKESK